MPNREGPTGVDRATRGADKVPSDDWMWEEKHIFETDKNGVTEWRAHFSDAKLKYG